MKTNIVHIALHVKDLVQAIQWYEQTLGFECSAAWPSAAPTYAHFEQVDGPRFALRTDAKWAGGGRITFDVADVQALWEQVQGRPEIAEELYGARTGHKKFVIADPDGNELVFQGKAGS